MTETQPTLLVDAHTLASRINDPAWVLFDCRFSLAEPNWGATQYRQGHIPGARYAHLDEDLSSPIQPTTGRHPLPDSAILTEKLSSWGVGVDTQVIAYDDLGGAFAVRLWWLLRWLGHEHVALLDGGLPAWTANGGTLVTSVPDPEPRQFIPQCDDDAWLETADIVANLKSPRFQVVDARAPERFRGEVEPIDPVAGHVPGAINLPLTGNLDQDGRFLPSPQLRERFLAALGERPPEQVVNSCGSGVNACHNIMAMELAGLRGAKLYAGSWSEWIRSPERPVATGE